MISTIARAWLYAPIFIVLAVCSLFAGFVFASLDEGEGEGSVEPICWEQWDAGT